MTGCHSTIERPDSVSRVAPPTTTMAKHERRHGQEPDPDGAAVASSMDVDGRAGHAKIRRAITMLAGDGADHIVVRLRSQSSPNSPAMPIRIRKLHRRVRPHRPGGGLGARRHGGGAVPGGEGQRARGDDLLRARRARLGLAGHAAHSLDVARREPQNSVEGRRSARAAIPSSATPRRPGGSRSRPRSRRRRAARAHSATAGARR